ncbi:hypothetical protein ASG43_11535 [Aureimonas sp. Leaf454]|uniref:hypothetical protein n=1 Tax=Aureimonas sp. Leaf454 TaxID=1736381 RepID=UPI00070013E8|nr:hypothetical protein [Aureimonas sp. Leaf454]KQT46255.1 hypothetical protein ASG43_11535 [Aureimonas sp. Leaf454]
MPRAIVPLAFLLLALPGCTAAPDRESGISTLPSSYVLPPRANTAPRGSEAFCRTYGQQTASNRLRSSTRNGGRGPSGFDTVLAEREGERAIARCLAGRTN